uniref:Tick transposon n=1 Tax=Rhipicephalus pulchellus TaxID=72859 RepID=L7M3S1_RHIPC
MHPEHNIGRRLARARTILCQVSNEERGVAFVDAASHANRKAFVAVVVDKAGRVVNSATVRTTDPIIAEQVAIALALTMDEIEVIYSDSSAALRGFAKGTVSEDTLRILRGKDITHHLLSWFPAHLGQIKDSPPNLNEAAHEAARDLSNRTSPGMRSTSEGDNWEIPTTYNELTKHFYLSRRIFPPPHKNLSRPQALTLRLLQTRTYPTLKMLNIIYPELYPSNVCPHCGEIASLEHMLWQCTKFAHLPNITSARWEAAIRSSSLADQLWAVHQAREAAEGLSLSVPTWERPATQ